MTTKRRRLPRFRSAEEFGRFAETHDLADYWDEFEEVKEPLELDPKLARMIDRSSKKKRLISIRLDAWQVQLAKAIAAKTGVPYHAVIRRWIAQGMRSA